MTLFEEHETAIADMAMLLGKFHDELMAHRVPEMLAHDLVVEFMRHLLAPKNQEENDDDKEE